MTKYKQLLAIIIAPLLLSTTALADSPGPDIQLPADEDGFAPAALANPVTLGGYGEMHYSRVQPEDGQVENEIDFHRLVLYVGRQLSDDFSFYSEIEVEHAIAGDGKVGEISVEQAYIDYRLLYASSGAGELILRTGIVLVPMGIINQWHEPPIFHGVERPSVDKVIIPSTWREGGIGVVGKPHPKVNYELYVLGGLNPQKFAAKDGIRGGRQKVGEARADALAIAGRAEFLPTTQSTIGVSGYFSMAGKNADAVDADVPVLGVAVDARGKFAGIEARAEFAMFTIGDTDVLNAVRDADGNPITNVADRIMGAYVELAYNVLRAANTDKELLPFARVEYYDTNPDDDTRTIMDIVAGLTYRPIPQVAFKGDVILRRPGGDVDGDNATLLNLGIGFLY